MADFSHAKAPKQAPERAEGKEPRRRGPRPPRRLQGREDESCEAQSQAALGNRASGSESSLAGEYMTRGLPWIPRMLSQLIIQAMVAVSPDTKRRSNGR